jgi:hypothetical protein
VGYFRFGDLDDGAVAALAERFAAATPFPHVVLDDMVVAPPDVAGEFPGPDWDGWYRFDDGYQRQKRQCSDAERIPDPFREMLNELNGPTTLRFLERVTGIDALLPDPYLEGGGLHASTGGGVLAPHTDFHLHQGLNLYRQLNLLVYLNPGWTEADGGALELFADHRAEQSAVRVVPSFGRCVLFRTDDRSVHGFPTPVREGAYRRSLALYYYTSRESESYSGDVTTYWRRHEQHRGVRRVRLAVYRGLILAARAVAHVAHRANPDWSRGR